MQNTEEIIRQAEQDCKPMFHKIDEVCLYNQEKVLKAFQDCKVTLSQFAGSSGYGYDDVGKLKLNEVFAHIFHAEDALVSPLITCGTHALSLTLFALLRPNDTFVCVSGEPYDTLHDVIHGENNGSLKEWGVHFDAINLLDDGNFDMPAICSFVKEKQPKLVYIQRSRGYAWRNAMSMEQVKEVVQNVKVIAPETIVMVDNCYGEFVDKIEPTDVGADVAVGSLIKNPGGGIAPTGAYIVGTKKCIEQVAFRLTAPSLGIEVGSYIGSYTMFFEGVFLAPHVVAGALKGALLMGRTMERLGYKTSPATNVYPQDIIRSVEFKTKEELIAFVQTIQKVSPVDSFVVPEPWAMPGYTTDVIMAAGTFVQGASIELSCDSPIKAPYIAYMQGGLTYEHIKLAVKYCVNALQNK